MNDVLPKRVLTVLMAVEDTINQVTNADKKAMKKPNLLSYNKLKQKYKKYLESEGDAENNYQAQVNKYRENPVNSEDEKKESSDEEEPVQTKEAPKAEEKPADEKPDADYGKEDAKEDEYYDEEDYGEEEAKGSDDESDSDEAADADNEINPKLAAKYSFLFKKRDEMTPAERRWKWVKKQALPKDLLELMEKLANTKAKKKKEQTIKKVTAEAVGVEQEPSSDFVTQLRARNDIDIDYTNSFNVKERLEFLKKDRIKGKYSPEYHVKVLSLMTEKMPDKEDADVTLKVEVLLLMIGTLF